MPRPLALTLYSTLLRLVSLLYLARLWWRGRREPLYRFRLAERFAIGLPPMPAISTGAVWVHAVSLGETLAARTLIDALRAFRPSLRFVLTTSTATGREAGAKLLREGDALCWLPFDTPGATRRFFAHVRPACGVLMETEIWPNLMRQAGLARVPMLMANARLSARSLRRGRRFESLLAPAAKGLALAMAQTEDDARRIRAFGVDAVEVCGNLKFDIQPSAALIEQGRRWREQIATAAPRAVLLAAVTREGEESALLAAWRARIENIRKNNGQATSAEASRAQQPLLLIVPRHPQRFDDVWQLIVDSGLRGLRRSGWAEALPTDAAQVDVWLGDSMGEMPLYYAMSDVALLGGSFEPLGGQNLIEAAACGCPVVMGPHTFNFADAAEQCIAAGAALRVADITQAVAVACGLMADPLRPQWSARALAFAAAHRGAAARMAARVIEYLDGNNAGRGA